LLQEAAPFVYLMELEKMGRNINATGYCTRRQMDAYFALRAKYL
jgi:hypothetical protein